MFCGGSTTFVPHYGAPYGATSACFSLKPGQTQWSSTQLCGTTCGPEHQNDMSSKRSWFSLTTVNNEEMIAVGGVDDQNITLSTMEKYSVTSHTWTTLSTKLPNARYGHCTVQSSSGI